MAHSIDMSKVVGGVNKCQKPVLSRMALRGTARIQAFHQYSARQGTLTTVDRWGEKKSQPQTALTGNVASQAGNGRRRNVEE